LRVKYRRMTMDLLAVLAQTTGAESTATAAAEQTQIIPVDWIYEQVTTLTWFQAVIAISFGMVYLLYGWRIFKVLAAISFGLLGLRAGMWLGNQLGNQLWGAVIGTILLAIVAVPLMRWAVSILGAAAGGIFACGIWYACGLPQDYMWAGAISGIIAGGMISFVIFKWSVMLFTSMVGAAITMTGLLALLYQYELTTTPPAQTSQATDLSRLNDLIHNHNWFLPVMLLVPTVIGIIVQNKLVKDSPKWEL
jgi:hypothetical protein